MSTSQALSTEITKAPTKKSYLNSIFNHEINLNYLIIIIALYLVATANFGFFAQVLSIYPFGNNVGFMVLIMAGVMNVPYDLIPITGKSTYANQAEAIDYLRTHTVSGIAENILTLLEKNYKIP